MALREARDPAKEVGKVVLFLGIECQNWTPEQFGEAAVFCHDHGVDTLAPKRADGGIKWYQNTARLSEERDAVLHEGVGYEPFSYCYGPMFAKHGERIPGQTQIDAEVAILAEMMSVNNASVCADLEQEWVGHPDSAQYFCERMIPTPGMLYLTTFADPVSTNFPVRELCRCVDAWVPQDYDNWLVASESQQVGTGMSIRFAALDLSQEFGANNVVDNANRMRQRGHPSLWLWEYTAAQHNPALLDKVIATFKG